jgi:energy-coupling factor transporter ATP-binding protein EcfA2
MNTITLKVDLYEYREVEKACRLAAEKLGLDERAVAADLERLARELEGYAHRKRKGGASEQRKVEIPADVKERCLKFLRKPNLIREIGARIGRAGIVGEEANRVLLFVVASSYKMPDTLHALIQGSSGSGKTRLLDVVARCMPPEDLRRYTRVTDNAFYNQAEDHFTHKLVCFEDLDGLREEAQLAVRELQSNEVLRSAVSVKDERGGITGGERIVRGPIASLACTTRGEVYEDNVSRSLVVAVDESAVQTQRVIAYQDARAAGSSSRVEQMTHQQFLANCVRLLKPCEVVNPFAGKVKLPEGAHKLRRLHELYLSFVRQVALINQYQRIKDNHGRIIAEVEDLRAAAEVLFESIVLKVDELDGSVRQFYERLKAYAETSDKQDFTQREVREALHVSRAQCSRFFARLQNAERITSRYSGNLRKVCYRLDEPDDYARIRNEIKAELFRQIDALKVEV